MKTKVQEYIKAINDFDGKYGGVMFDLIDLLANDKNKYGYDDCDDAQCDDEGCRLHKAFNLYLKNK